MTQSIKWVCAIFASLLLITGCGGDAIVQKAEAVKNSQKHAVKQKKDDKKSKENLYNSLAVDPEIAADQNEKETVGVVSSNDVETKSSYTDPKEFARFVAKKVFDFRNGALRPEGYYSFIKVYGASKMNGIGSQDIYKSSDTAIPFLTNLQNLIKEKNVVGHSYKLSELKFSKTGNQAYFYRAVNTSSEENDFITTIMKENDIWKFYDDRPSPGFNEESSTGDEANGNDEKQGNDSNSRDTGSSGTNKTTDSRATSGNTNTE